MGTMLNIIGLVVAFVLVLVVIALLGYGVLFFLGATIGGILTLIDRVKSDSMNQ